MTSMLKYYGYNVKNQKCIAQLNIYLNLCASTHLKKYYKQKMINYQTHKLCTLQANTFAGGAVFIERLQPIFFVITDRHTYTPRI